MDTSKYRALIATTAFALVLGVSQAHAGGFGLKERSSRAQGASFAGVTAGSGGLESMGYNPAAIGVIDQGQGNAMLANGLSLVLPKSEGQPNIGGVPVGASVDAGRLAGLAHGYAGYRLEEDILIGASLYTPFGLTTQYEAGWLGQFDAITSKVQSFTLAPTVAWEPMPELTLALAMNIHYTNVRLTTAATQLDGDTINLGFSVGALWDVTPSTTIGVAYQHGYELDVEGLVTVNGVASAPANAKAELPAVASIGIVQGVTDDLRILGEAQWQQWSSFDFLDVSAPALGLVQRDVQGYKDAFYVALGAEYDVNTDLTVRLGAAWDQTPTDGGLENPGQFPPGVNPLATNRTARLPDTDRLWLSIGASYELNDHTTLNAGYSYLFGLEDSTVGLRNAPAGASVTYEASAHILSVGGSISFGGN